MLGGGVIIRNVGCMDEVVVTKYWLIVSLIVWVGSLGNEVSEVCGVNLSHFEFWLIMVVHTHCG